MVIHTSALADHVTSTGHSLNWIILKFLLDNAFFTMTAKVLVRSLASFYCHLSISGQIHKFIIYAIMTRYCSRQIEVSRIFVSFSSRVLN